LEQYVTIELFGQSHRFRADTETEDAQKAANYLMEQIAKVEAQHGATLSQTDRMTILLSVALNIAHDNQRLRNSETRFNQQLSAQSGKILNLLDALS
jgi:cell division protein ZapA (FtsZ GTPase activity inhibitor)